MDTKTKDVSHIHQWARLMARLQARACVISRITGMSNAASRRMWHQIYGKGSPSGQQPADDTWFLKTGLRRAHAALILQLYAQSSQHLPQYAAFTHAYYHYARITAGLNERRTWDDDPAFRSSEDDYVIPFSRAYFLVLIYTDEEMADGTRKCKLQVRRCRSCGALYLSHTEEISRKCPGCMSKKT